MISFLNINDDGTARALLSGCYKFGATTLLAWGGATMTCVVESEERRCLACSFRTRSEGDWHTTEHYTGLDIGGEVSNSITSVQKDYMVVEIWTR